ncbi:MAG: LPP20 family lipoprotein, partial [Spirochaetales bacterium]|nr:LPP20 family lipoprotein [Spirochaetales bacterium]
DKYIDPVIVKGVIDFTDPLYSFLWDTSPDNGTLVFFSSIPRKAIREEEVLFAAADAARQASILYTAKVDAKFAVKSNNKDLGFLEAINIQYDKALAGEIKAKIKILHHYRDNEGTYTLAELDGISYRGDFEPKPGEGNNPDWLYNVPFLPGYLVSIGAVQRSRYKIDSIRKADEQALANLAKQVSVVIKAKRTDLDSEVSGSAFSETNYEVTSAFIRGFYVLGRWSTDNGNTYHTLAVCPVDQ